MQTPALPTTSRPLQARPWRIKRMAVDAGEEEAAAAEGRGRGRGVTTAEQEEADMERFLQVRWWLVSVCVLLSGCDLHETEEGEGRSGALA